MLNKDITIKNETGIHARPASIITKTATAFVSEVSLIKNEMVYNAKSIINVLSMGMKKDEVITLQVEGIDESEAIKAITDLFESNFGEV